VNLDMPLVFFHFSSFRVDSGELPLHYYTRFSMKDRPDLVALYAAYNEELKSAGHARYSRIRWAYAPTLAERGSIQETRQKLGAAVWRGLVWGFRQLPRGITERAHRVLTAARASDV
jgi:hypothetical protein